MYTQWSSNLGFPQGHIHKGGLTELNKASLHVQVCCYWSSNRYTEMRSVAHNLNLIYTSLSTWIGSCVGEDNPTPDSSLSELTHIWRWIDQS